MDLTYEAQLGGYLLSAPLKILPRSPCSLLLLPPPFYQFSLLFFHLSLLPAPFQFFLLLLDNFSCSLFHFLIFCCSLIPFQFFLAPCSQITFSLLSAPLLILGHVPCSLGSLGPFSLLLDYP